MGRGYKLRRPCAECPFRTDVPPYLTGVRAADISIALLRGSEFACHETTEHDDEGEAHTTPDSMFCAGALIVLEKMDQPNQMMRIAERLEMYDRTKLFMDSPVHEDLDGFIRHHGEETGDETESCSVVGYQCEAPAGYMVGGVAITAPPGELGATFYCGECGEPVCDSCSSNGVCDYCQEREDEDGT